MCTSIVEIARAEGMAKRGDDWFALSHAVVAYDHARHAALGDVITLDFINAELDPGARAGIELTLETAKELRAALDRAIVAADFEEAEVRGKGAVPKTSGGVRGSYPSPRELLRWGGKEGGRRSASPYGLNPTTRFFVFAAFRTADRRPAGPSEHPFSILVC